ncbi:MAG: amino acid adenylation domain-containing protein, partial [Acidobacteria bacterium]|nr:amino acid adenylation domain-containing protein [Acidobacteriota bacterium]
PVQRIHDSVDFSIEYKNLATEDTEDTEKLGDRQENLATDAFGVHGQTQTFEKLGDRQEKTEVTEGKDQHSAFSIQHFIRFFIRPFDLTQAPLLRAGILNNNNGSYLLVDMHHIITDGVSHSILQKEFLALYQGNDLPELPALRLQYKDFSQWQNGEKENLKQQETYWLKELAGELPVLDLPGDYPRPKIKSFAGDTIHFEISKQETNELNVLALKENATLFMVLTAVFNVLLAKLSGQEEIIIGTPVAGRRHSDLENIIGIFINTLTLRNYPAAHYSFKEFLLNVKEQSLLAFENQEFPFEELVNHLPLKKDIARNPVFDIMFSWQNIDKISLPHTGIPDEFANIKKAVKFDLTLTAAEKVESVDSVDSVDNNQGLFLLFQYCTDLFKKETIERFIQYFKNIVTVIVNDPDIILSEIEITTDEEKKQILFDFNQTAAIYPEEQTICQLVAGQVEKMPDHIIAVGNGQNQITYRVLNKRANHMANHLGKSKEAIVGIMVEPGLEMVIGIVGILKTGGVFLPIEPESPADRVNFSLRDSCVNVLLSQSHLTVPVKQNFERINLDDAALYTGETRGIINSSKPGDPIYVIYTSGTSGRPKGVLIANKNMVNYVYWFVQTIGLTSCDRAILTSSFAFDALYTQFFSSLLTGCQLHLVSRKTFLFPGQLLTYLSRNRISYIKVTPSLFNLVANSPEFAAGLAGCLRFVMMGGEEINVNDVETAHRLYPHWQMMNHYGPTETTIGSIARFLDFDDFEKYKAAPTIGKPINNTRVYILDKGFNVVPVGVVGGLYIGGDGVGMGYLNKPELTAERFKRNVISHSSLVISNTKNPSNFTNDQCPMTNDYFYSTGDLARWLPAGPPVGGDSGGVIEFLGRADDQVKIRGYRIELGEIERRLAGHPSIKEVVLIAREEEGGGGKYICAYFTAKEEISFAELRKYLAAQLPEYMIPAYFIHLEKIPLTVHGKVDRNALPNPANPGTNGLKDNAAYEPPQTDIERKLVDIWEKVLGRTHIGINENFFQLGGDSIKSIQIISRLNHAGYKLEMRDLFQYPVIAELAPYVKKFTRLPGQTVITGTIPLTPIQEIFFERSYTEPHYYNQSVMFYAKNRLDKEAIKAIFTKIQAHHDALRMTYEINKESGEIIQKNHGLDYLLALEEYEIKNDLTAIVEKIQAGIDLQKEPLMKLALFHLPDGEGDRLLIVIHHLVIDGISWRILFEDIDTLYGQYQRGEKLVLPSKTDSFKHWSEKLRAYANSKAFLEEKNYWQKLEAMSMPTIPKDFDVEDNYIKDTESVSFSLNEEETNLLLTRVNGIYRTEINDILLTALGMGIKKTFSHDRAAIVLEGHGREEILADMDISRTVGWFTTLYPVVMDFSYTENPGRQIKEIKETLRRIPNKGTGYGILKYLTDSKNTHELEFTLKPQIRFNYLGQFDADVKQLSFFEPAKESTGSSQSPNNKRDYLIDVSGLTANGRLTMTISFNKTHFKPGTTAAFAENVAFALRHLIAFCSAKENSEPTPSDFTYKGLAIETIERLTALYPDLEDLYTLAPMQEGMLFHAVADNASHSYFQQLSYRLLGELDMYLVEKSLHELIKRHEILRTAFLYKDIDRPVQLVLKTRPCEFYYEDISTLETQAAKDDFIKHFKEKDKQHPFDLSTSVLMRTSILRIGEKEYEFIWSHPHILMDGWCNGILNTEFFEIYTGYLENRPYHLPAIKPYRTYICWLEKQDKEKSAQYWENYLESYEEQAGIPVIGVKKANEPVYKNEQIMIDLGRDKTTLLAKLAAANHVTVNTVAQVLWALLLGKYNSKEDVVFGAVVSGRPSGLEGVESMIGLFINTIPVRIRFAEKMKLNHLFRQVQQEALAGEPYHYHPLAEIQSRSPLKQNLINHILVFENFPFAEQIEGYGGRANKRNEAQLQLTNIDAFAQTNYDFNVIFSGTEQLEIELRYNGSVYDSNYVKRVGEHFMLIIDQALNNPSSQISAIELIPEAAKKEILTYFNEDLNEKCEILPVQSHLANVFQEHKKNTAISYGTLNVTYAVLEQKAACISQWLAHQGIQPGSFTGIYIENKIDIIAAIIGIVQRGSIFVPLGTALPAKRIDHMIRLTHLQAIITDTIHETILREMIEKDDKKPVCVISDSFYQTHGAVENKYLEIAYEPGDKLYVYFTSGSTGTPTAVLGRNKSLVQFIQWEIETFAVTETGRVGQLTTVGFDPFLRDIFVPLLAGAAICIPVQKNILLDGGGLVDWLDKSQITLVHCVPSLFRIILDSEKLNPSLFPHLKYILLHGEPVRPNELVGWYSIFGNRIQLGNYYGPTETTLATTFHFINFSDVQAGRIPVGLPIRGSRTIILNKNLQPCDRGIMGEIYIRTAYSTYGYLNNPELNAQRFIKNPFSTVPGDLIYRTGDLGRELENGAIEVLGRIDRQVKIRGVRIELENIENCLLKHPDIERAAVLSRKNNAGENFLCAYIVFKKQENTSMPATSELRAYLAQDLPDYMIPSYFVPLEKIPLNPNGKIDIRALPMPMPRTAKDGHEANYIAPRNAGEEKLAALWAEVLNIEKESIGIEANFFELGGHSLKVMALTAKIHREFNIQVPVDAIFKTPNIKGLSEYIAKASQQRLQDKYTAIEPIEEKEYYPLSSAQKRLYFLQQLDLQGTGYNISRVVPLGKEIDRDRLEWALKQLIHGHESLRTSFHMIAGELVQKIHEHVEFAIKTLATEVTEVTEKLGDRQEKTDLATDACGVHGQTRPFDLSQAPLIRSGLILHPDGNHTLLVDIHHIAADGTSMTILTEDFMRLYKGDGNAQLEPLQTRYRDFAAWQNDLFASGAIASQETYWLELLAGELPCLDLPVDSKRPAIFTFAGDSYELKLTAEETGLFKALCRRSGGTLYMNMLAVLNTLFYKYTGREDIIIGSGIAGRRHANLQGIVGMFVNTLVMRNYPHPGMPYELFLKEVITNSIKAFENQDVQFEDLVDKLDVERDTSRNPVFDIMMIVQNFRRVSDRENLEVEYTAMPEMNMPLNTTSKFDMTFSVIEQEEDILINLQYYKYWGCYFMNFDKLTSSFQMALSDAQSLALGRDNPEISPIHLMKALLDQEGGTIRPILTQCNVNIPILRNKLDEALDG